MSVTFHISLSYSLFSAAQPVFMSPIQLSMIFVWLREREGAAQFGAWLPLSNLRLERGDKKVLCAPSPSRAKERGLGVRIKLSSCEPTQAKRGEERSRAAAHSIRRLCFSAIQTFLSRFRLNTGDPLQHAQLWRKYRYRPHHDQCAEPAEHHRSYRAEQRRGDAAFKAA